LADRSKHTAEPLVPGNSDLEVEIAFAKLKKYKLINSVWNKEELPDQWKFIIVPVHKKGDKTDCNNYHGISLL
jgi:hypothetical protein